MTFWHVHADRKVTLRNCYISIMRSCYSFLFTSTLWKEGPKHTGHAGVNMYCPALYWGICELHFLSSPPLPALPPFIPLWCSLQQSDQSYFCLVPETKPSALSWTGVKWGKVCRGGENVPFVTPLYPILYMSCPLPNDNTPAPTPKGGLMERGGWLVHSASVKRFQSSTMPGRSRQVQARAGEEWREDRGRAGQRGAENNRLTYNRP